jgi:hypothetical protein
MAIGTLIVALIVLELANDLYAISFDSVES